MSSSQSPIVVHKDGGSSVASTEKLRRFARKIAESQWEGNRVAIVVSAMGGEAA